MRLAAAGELGVGSGEAGWVVEPAAAGAAERGAVGTGVEAAGDAWGAAGDAWEAVACRRRTEEGEMCGGIGAQSD